jgi:hypothetical protein
MPSLRHSFLGAATKQRQSFNFNLLLKPTFSGWYNDLCAFLATLQFFYRISPGLYQHPDISTMVRLREIPRTAAFAWSPGAATPLIAAGTKAGAVSADFSNETTLEIWDLDMDNPTSNPELQVVGSISADSRLVFE